MGVGHLWMFFRRTLQANSKQDYTPTPKAPSLIPKIAEKPAGSRVNSSQACLRPEQNRSPGKPGSLHWAYSPSLH